VTQLRLLWLTSGEHELTQLVSTAFAKACKDLSVHPWVVDVRSDSAPKRVLELDADVAVSRFAFRPYGHAAAQAIEDRGVPIINRSTAIRIACDQIETLRCFSRARLPFPRSVVLDGTQPPDDVIEYLGLPLVVKPPQTSGGKSIQRLFSRAELTRALSVMPPGDRLLCQRFEVGSVGVDRRLVVVGGRVVAAMERQARSREWRANLDLGGVGRPINPSPYQVALALAATNAIGLDVAGVDMLTGAAGEDLLLEVNAKPGLRICEITKTDVMRLIVQFAIRGIHR
jgi:RimK family alpha-L-glutamate ligase